MASLLDDVIDIESRTELVMQKELVEKFLSTYCLGTLNEMAKLTYKDVKISHMQNQKEFTIKYDFAPVTIYKYLGRSSCAFSIYRYFTLANGNIKPLYGEGWIRWIPLSLRVTHINNCHHISNLNQNFLRNR